MEVSTADSAVKSLAVFQAPTGPLTCEVTHIAVTTGIEGDNWAFGFLSWNPQLQERNDRPQVLLLQHQGCTSLQQ